MTTLFASDPVMAAPHRDSKGRFATAEHAAADKALQENKLLRLEAEKYRRMALAVTERMADLEKENKALRAKAERYDQITKRYSYERVNQ